MIFKHLINGQLVQGLGERLKVTDPATSRICATVHECSNGQLEMAVESAKSALPTWSGLPPKERSGILLKIADIIERNAARLADIETQNVGKPRHLSEATDVSSSIDAFRFFAGAARCLTGPAANEYRSPNHTSMMRRDPIGVVAGITPWNYPLMMAAWKIAPAIAAGNTVVLKPSEITPLSTLTLGALIADSVPNGVINILHGRGATIGSSLIHHECIDMISITGSVSTGQHVIDAAKAGFKKTHLELGGKAPALILRDADLDMTCTDLSEAAFYNSGQDCTAPTRIYIDAEIYDEFVERLASAARAISVGDPWSRTTFMGPLVSERHLEHVDSITSAAISRASRVVTGGKRLDLPGFFYAPTVLENVDQDDSIVQTEVFGLVCSLKSGPLFELVPASDMELRHGQEIYA